MPRAMGEGEALTALSVAMGVPAEDRTHFSSVMHQNCCQRPAPSIVAASYRSFGIVCSAAR